MSAAKRIRWECPTGEHAGALGPSRPRRDSIVRYCLPCSVDAGRLVERVAPALERKRAAKSERRMTASERAAESLAKRARVTARDHAGNEVVVDVLAEVAECSAMLGIRTPKVTVARSSTRSGTSGRAWPDDHRLHITTSAGEPEAERLREVILHECVHLANTHRRKAGRWAFHGPQFKRALLDAARQRWPEISSLVLDAEAMILSGRAYDLDDAIVAAMNACTLLFHDTERMAA